MCCVNCCFLKCHITVVFRTFPPSDRKPPGSFSLMFTILLLLTLCVTVMALFWRKVGVWIRLVRQVSSSKVIHRAVNPLLTHGVKSAPINDPTVRLFLSGGWCTPPSSPCWCPRSRFLLASGSSWLDRWENAFTPFWQEESASCLLWDNWWTF